MGHARPMTSTPRHPGPEQSGQEQAGGDSRQLDGGRLQARLVRENGRDTWFVVNDAAAAISDIPVDLAGGGGVRRVLVNGEPVEFTETEDSVVAAAPQPLRAGQGTIVVVHYR